MFNKHALDCITLFDNYKGIVCVCVYDLFI